MNSGYSIYDHSIPLLCTLALCQLTKSYKLDQTLWKRKVLEKKEILTEKNEEVFR